MMAQVVLGTRGSDLARAQAGLVEEAIRAANPDVIVQTKIIATQGDRAKAVDALAGRKGLFTAEIEHALVAAEVDVAVHSAKDLPSETTPGTQIAAVLPRGPVDDVLVSKTAGGLASLPNSAKVATGSVRRRHQLLWRRPDLHLIELRGNVPTRLRKLAENDWNGIVLACAGLQRLGALSHGELNVGGQRFFLDTLPPEIFLPAGGQGIIAIQIRAGDQRTKGIVEPVNAPETLLCLQAERSFLHGLHGDCNSPVGVLAKIDGGQMRIRAQVFRGEGSAPRQAEVAGDCEEGATVAAELLRRITQSIP